MYQLNPSEVSLIAGLVCGSVAGLALLVVPALRRALLAAAFAWLAWRLYVLGPQQLGGELLGHLRAIIAHGDFVRGVLVAKAGVALTALLLRRRTG